MPPAAGIAAWLAGAALPSICPARLTCAPAAQIDVHRQQSPPFSIAALAAALATAVSAALADATLVVTVLAAALATG